MGILIMALLLVKVGQVDAISTPPVINAGQVDVSLSPAIVKVGQVGASLSPVLYSIFLETEINFGGEGGIYAEQIRNRDFEALGRGDFNFAPDPSQSFLLNSSSMTATPGLDPGEPAANFSDFRPWSPVGPASLTLLNATAPFATNPNVLELHASIAGEGVSNPGYWGIGCGAEVGHTLSLYAKSALPLTLTARLRQINVGSIISSVNITIHGGDNWSRHTAALLPLKREESAVSSCEFELVLGSAGKVTLDSVSLMPADAVAGVLRRDVVDKLRDLRPGFVRTPGGSYILGSGPRTQYNWTNTVGPAAARPGHYNAAWGYWVTDGLGFFELLMLAEALDSELLMAVQDGQHSGPGGQYAPDEDYEKYIQGAVDMLEFATGDADTRWGRVRASMGHEAPFPLRRVEIGNEEVDHPTGSYARHFGILATAMRRANPELEVISSGRWGNPRYYRRFDNSPCLTGQDCWAWDDHLYGTADSMAMLATFYDNFNATPRGGPMPPVFVGEWGAANGPVRTLRAAVGEALFLLGLERNGDVVRAASFAPLLKNTNGNSSLPCCGNNHNLLNFNATALFAIPSFYGQKLFRETLGSHTLVTTTSGGHANDDGSGSDTNIPNTNTSSPIPSSSSALWGAQASTSSNTSASATVKLVNYQGSKLPMTIAFDAAALACVGSASESNPAFRVVSATVLGGGDPLSQNTLDAPTTVVPRDFLAAVTVAANGSAIELTLPEWSIAVVTVECREDQGPVVQPSNAARSQVAGPSKNYSLTKGQTFLQPVFINGDRNYSCFAIPALLGTPNGTLLAFAEGRGLRDTSGHRECHDLGDVMIVLKRSDDGGRSWSDLRIVRDEYWQGAKAIGNAAPVFDAVTQVVHLVYMRDGLWTYTMQSHDLGNSWSEPINITASTRFIGMHAASGPPGGVQLPSGRIAVCLSGDIMAENGVVKRSYALMSDDHGTTWRSGLPVPMPDNSYGSECQLALLGGERLAVVMKGALAGVNGRLVSTSEDGGETWSNATLSQDLQPSTPCEGSVVGNPAASVLYTSLPHSNRGRFNMSIFSSSDSGKSWQSLAEQYSGPSFYSSLAISPDKRTLFNLFNLFDEPGWPNPPDGNRGGLALSRLDV